MGTGSGYITFALAERYPDSKVIGIDIVKNRLDINKNIAKDKQLKNIKFINYDGIKILFENESIDVIYIRYVVHLKIKFKVNDNFTLALLL